MNATTDQAAQVEAGPYRVFVRAFTALRIFTGLVWLSNGLAKLIDKGGYDWGFISFNLITAARRSPSRTTPQEDLHRPAGRVLPECRVAELGFLRGPP